MTLLLRAELLVEAIADRMTEPMDEYGRGYFAALTHIMNDINSNTFTAQAADGVLEALICLRNAHAELLSVIPEEDGGSPPWIKNKDIERADAAIAAYNTPSTGLVGDWLPMETAPKIGVIWLANDHSMRLGFWLVGKQHECRGSIGGGWKDQSLSEQGDGPMDLWFKPTKWQPCPKLPQPPSRPTEVAE